MKPAANVIDVRLATTEPISIQRAPAVIDGVPCEPGDRILVRVQTNPVENGIYIWHGAGLPMTLAADSPRNPQGVLFQQKLSGGQEATLHVLPATASSQRATQVRCRVIAEPAPNTRAVFETDRDEPSFTFFQGVGKGSTDLLCGGCGRTLVARLQSSTQLQQAVMKCPRCGSFNDSGVPTN